MTALASLDRVKAPESLRKGRVTEVDAETWTPREREVRACCHCHVVYQSAGYAWDCEHWHEGL
ncbi:hypothetical protein [Amycolatopsis sp. H20-H5]|uniref:hypothetical protein n=1 Tax=Amycolatopsis sp. H20-H5 TaxID=3046309 RepID=UPI002DBA2BBF|nr:hypothetical protein [Amycolatopsis sp. H20-H5]MEC3975072.1 hypothetical protein [Amycolatopsis sp. H20-H5]